MANFRFRKVDPRVWSDAKFLSLTDDGKQIWLYLLTTPAHCSIPGVIVGGAAAHAEILRWSPERFREGFRQLFAKGLANHDLEARLIWLPNAIRYNEPQNPNVIVGWSKAWPEIPECALKHEIWSALKRFLEGSPKLSPERFPELFPEPFRHGFPNQEQEQEQKKEQEQEGGVGGLAAGPPAPPAKSKRSKPKLSDPTPEEWKVIEVVLTRLTEYSSVPWTARSPRGGTTEHAELVLARMRAGASERDLRVVVWHRGHEWQDNPEMKQYLRPSTLFARKKFAEYLPQAIAARETYERDEATRSAARQRESARPADSNGAFMGLMSIAGGVPK